MKKKDSGVDIKAFQAGGRDINVSRYDSCMVETVVETRVRTGARKKITIEVEVPEGLGEDFIEILRTKVWELYLTYRWLQLPEAPNKIVDELAKEAKRGAAEKIK